MSKKIVQAKFAELELLDENEEPIDKTPEELLNMPPHAFVHQYARAGKFFNIDWLPSSSEFSNKNTERIWPPFERYLFFCFIFL